MKVILLQDIRGLGKKFDVKNVADGYARNFLFPKNFAKTADEKSLEELAFKKTVLERKEKKTAEKLKIIAGNLAEQEFVFKAKSDKNGMLFGSVAPADVKKRLIEACGAELHELADNFQIDLEKPLKSAGEHQVSVNLGKGIEIKIKIRIESE